MGVVLVAVVMFMAGFYVGLFEGELRHGGTRGTV